MSAIVFAECLLHVLERELKESHSILHSHESGIIETDQNAEINDLRIVSKAEKLCSSGRVCGR